MSDAVAQTVTRKFLNRGLDQNRDISELTDGQLLEMLNVTSDQEGSICSKAGYRRLGQATGYSLPHTIVKWNAGGASSPRYVGEGQYIVRTTDWSSYTLLESGIETDLKRRISAVPYSAGGNSNTMYFATPNKMLKATSPTADLAVWGLFPPVRPARAELVDPDLKAIYSNGTPVSIDNVTDYMDVINEAQALNLGQFAADVPSGSPESLYASDDVIEIDVSVTNLTSLKTMSDIRLEFDAGDGSWQDYYTTSVLPVNMQYASVFEHLSIRKKDFETVGLAGSATKNWSTISKVRVTAKAKSLDTGVGPEVTVVSITMRGGSGPDSSPAAARGYKYIFTYRDPQTRNESNPSVFMVDEYQIYPRRQPIKLTLYGTDQAGVTGAGSIAIYRAGGTFADDNYRLIGYAANAGGNVIFYDRVADESLQGARTATFDNDPPVPSTMPIPFVGSVASVAGDGSGAQTWTFSSSSISDSLANHITVGSKAYITNGAASETVIVSGVTSNSLSFWCQRPHKVGAENPLSVSVEVAAGRPCFLAAHVLDSIFLAGDPKNPEILYKSALGRPESFPFATEGGTVNSIRVGSAANPIMNICEFNGALVSMNLNNIYVVQVWNNTTQAPQETPSQRGLFARWAWCKANNEIWFLAYDGIYSWSGGAATLRSGPIRWMFRNRRVNGIAPIDKSDDGIQWMKMESAYNKVYFVFKNIDGQIRRLAYDLATERWEIDDTESVGMYVEEDTGTFICSIWNAAGAYIVADQTYGTAGTTLGFNDSDGVNGTSIGWRFKTGFFDFGAPDFKKHFTSFFVEMTKADTASSLTVNFYYDYSSDIGDSYTIGAGGITAPATRTVVALPLQNQDGTTRGKEARCVAVEFIGANCTKQSTLHSIGCTYIPLERIQRGNIGDWTDAGHPWDKRLQEIVVDYDATGQDVTFAVDVISGIEGATKQETVQTFTLSGRGQRSIPAVDGVVGKRFRLRPTVTTNTYMVFSAKFVCENYPPDIVPFTSYSNYGTDCEKHLYVLRLAVDTANKDVPVDIEADGSVKQSITVKGTEANRSRSFAINVDVIGKNIRLKVGTIPSGGKFQLFDHKFDMVALPPEIVLSTQYSDYGYDYSKYIEQVSFDVNTAGQTVPVKIYGDGVLKQTVNVTGTYTNRNQIVTLNPSLTCKMLRIEVDPATIPSGGRFQLFDFRPIFQRADKGPVTHCSDWDAVGHPYDKELKQVTVEFETGGDVVTVAIDTLTGLNGNVETLGAVTFQLQSSGRGYKTIPVDGLVAKMFRIRSLGISSNGTHAPGFKMWGAQWQVERRPPDIILGTDPTDLKWPCDKVFRGLGLQVDTGNVTASVSLKIDGTVRDTWSVTTTDADRIRYLSPSTNSELIGKMYSLDITPGTNGKFQLYDVDFNVVKDACAYRYLDSFEQALGQVGYTYLKQCWLDYSCAGNVIFRIYSDGQLFYEKTLPPHSGRLTERFYLPAKNGSVPNKAKKHRFTFEAANSAQPFKIYRDSSRAEYLNLAAGARSSFNQFVLWQEIIIPV